MNERQRLLAILLVADPTDPGAISEAMGEIRGGNGEHLFRAILDEISDRKDNPFRCPLMALGLFRDMASISVGVAGYLLGRLQAHDSYDHEVFHSVELHAVHFDSPEYVGSLMRLGAETSDPTWQSYYLAQATAMHKRLDAVVKKENQQARRTKQR